MLPYPYYINDQTLAISSSGINPAIWARITGTDGAGAYSWEQVSPAELGTVVETINSRYGTITDSQAYEISGNLQVPAGVIVQLLPGVNSYPSYVFRYQSALIEAEIDAISLPYYGWHQVLPANNGTYDPGPLNGSIDLNFATELNDVPGISVGDRTLLYQGYSSGAPSARTYPQQTGNATQFTIQNLTLTNVYGGTYTLTYFDIANDPGQMSGNINGTDNASLIQAILAGSGWVPAPNISVTGNAPYFALQFNASLADYPMLQADSSQLRNDQEWFFVFTPASAGGNTTISNSTVIYNGTVVYGNTTINYSNLTFHNTTTITSLVAFNTTFAGNITIGAATIYNTTITATNVTFSGGANYAEILLTGGGTANASYNWTLIEGCQNHTFPASGTYTAFEINGVQNLRSSGNISVIAFKFPSGEITFDHCCNGSTGGNVTYTQPIYTDTGIQYLPVSLLPTGVALTTTVPTYEGDVTLVSPGTVQLWNQANNTFGLLDPMAGNGQTLVSNSSQDLGYDLQFPAAGYEDPSGTVGKTFVTDANGSFKLYEMVGLNVPTAVNKGSILVPGNGSTWIELNVGADGTKLTANSSSPTGLKWV